MRPPPGVCFFFMEFLGFYDVILRLHRVHGVDHTDSFPLFLKECEFRFNYGTPKQQLGNVEAVV